MIVFLNGTLVEKRLTPAPASAVIDVGGVGYEAFIPLSTYDALPREDSPCKLLIHDYVREDAHVLFGFSSAAERDLFMLLQGVSGIGPKTALSALSGAQPRQIRAAIASSDAKFLARLPGIGKRTAERLCVELKGKLDPLEAAAADGGPGDRAQADPALRDAVLALVQLGQSEETAVERVRAAAARAGAVKDTATLVRLALSAH